MAVNNNLRSTQVSSALLAATIAKSRNVGDASDTTSTTDADASTSTSTSTSASATTTSTASDVNPIGTGTAKLLTGDTQDQDNALQTMKYDAYAVALADQNVTTLTADGGSTADITAATTAAQEARSTYESDLTAGSASGLTSARINRYLTGGANPVPETALIPSAASDISDFVASLSGSDSTAATDTSTASSTATSSSTVANVDSTLTAAQQTHLSTSSDVLSTSSISGVTSGNLSADFDLYPSGTPSVDDVNQGSSEDCYYLSALTSMASTTAGQTTLKNAIKGPDTTTGDYTVTLTSPSGTPVDIAVNPDNLPVDASGSPAFNSSGTDSKQANWVNLMEAAFAKYNDVYKTNTDTANSSATGYDAIMETGITDTSFNTALSGKSSSVLDLTSSSNTATSVTDSMRTALAAGQPVEAYNLDTADSTDAEGNTVVASHAYAVTNVSADGSTVTVRNPWGVNQASTLSGESADGTITMSTAEFMKTFEQVND